MSQNGSNDLLAEFRRAKRVVDERNTQTLPAAVPAAATVETENLSFLDRLSGKGQLTQGSEALTNIGSAGSSVAKGAIQTAGSVVAGVAEPVEYFGLGSGDNFRHQQYMA